MSYDSVNPSKINHDQTIQYNDFMANVGVEIELRVVLGTKNFYISAYNYEDQSAVVSISMFSDSATSDLVPNPIPIKCGKNAACSNDGTCLCNDGYFGNPYVECSYDLCKDITCDGASQCVNGKCECRDGYSLIDGVCTSPLCSNQPIVATENQYGYAMGHLESPFYGIQDYPTNFDCWYNVTAPRTEGIT